METYECPRCLKEKEVNTTNFILGEEVAAFTDGEDYHIWLDAKRALDAEFVCRECVIALVMRYLEMRDETS